MKTEYLGKEVYEDDHATYCPECFESAGTRSEIEEIPLQDPEGYFGRILKCSFCDWQAHADEDQSHRSPSILTISTLIRLFFRAITYLVGHATNCRPASRANS